jgi:hypothetical protein
LAFLSDSIFTNIRPVKEQTGCHYDNLTDQVLKSTSPLILRGLVDTWPVVTKGRSSHLDCINYLKGFYNQNPVQAMVAEANVKGRLFYNDRLDGFNFSRQNLNLNDVLDKIHSHVDDEESPTYYVGSTSIDHVLPGFRNENDIPVLQDKPLKSIWIGNRSRVAAHYDVTDNIACAVAGKRRFTLFPPEQIENLYVGPLDFTPAGQAASIVDFHNPDFERFPKFKNAIQHAQVAYLDPGDAIFIPSMWWHHVEGLDSFNVLVNYWWRQVDNHIGAPADALNHALLCIKDLPEEQRQAWKTLFDYYVFNPADNSHIPKVMRGSLNPIDDLAARKLRATLINKLNR